MHPLRVVVIGAGAFGRNHLRVYRSLAATNNVSLVAAVDTDAGIRAQTTAEYNIPTFASVDDLLSDPTIAFDAASICVPTVHHAAIAGQLLRHKIDVLIEKPFAATLAEADEVLAIAAAHNRIVQVGHLERFNPAVTAVEPFLDRPMFFEAHRLSIFTPRSLDVDVVLDLMIHDLDIVLHLAQSPVRELRAVGLPVLSRKVDIANVRIEFESGCIANFTASRVSTEQVRKLRFFQTRQYLSLDFARQELLTINIAADALKGTSSSSSGGPSSAGLSGVAAGFSLRNTNDHESGFSPGPPPAADALKGTSFSSSMSNLAQTSALAAEGTPTAHPSAGLSLQKFTVEKTEPLRLEIEDFLRAIRTRTAPRVTGEQGRAALALALDINAAIATHAHRANL